MIRWLNIALAATLLVPLTAFAQKSYDQALVESLTRHYQDRVKAVVDEGGDIDAKDEHGKTALIWAASMGDAAVVQLLLDRGADVNAKDATGQTALFNGVEYPEVVKLLLASDADTEIREGKLGRTPLMRAIYSSDDESMKLLLEAGADVDSRDDKGETVLILAIGFIDQSDKVRILLDHGADIEAADNEGRTALVEAILRRRPEIVRLLLEKGANPNAKGSYRDTPPLMWAISNFGEDIVRLLLGAGADVNVTSSSGRTPLMQVAGRNVKLEMVNMLLDAGADVNVKDSEGMTALISAAYSGDTAKMDVLTKAGAKRELGFGMTKLMWAVADGDVAEAKSLLDSGVEVDAMNNHGETALMFSARCGRTDVARLLIENGADVNRRGEGCAEVTPLMCAARGPSEMIKLLLDTGADVNVGSATALLFATEHGDPVSIKMLLDAGADPNIKPENSDRDSPLMRAVRKGEIGIVKMLLDSGADVNARCPNGRTVLSNIYEYAPPYENPELSELLNNAAGLNSPRVAFERGGRDDGPLEAVEVSGLDISKGLFDVFEDSRITVKIATFISNVSGKSFHEETVIQLDEQQSERFRNGEVVALPPMIQRMSEENAHVVSEALSRGRQIKYRVSVSLLCENVDGVEVSRGLMQFTHVVAPIESD